MILFLRGAGGPRITAGELVVLLVVTRLEPFVWFVAPSSYGVEWGLLLRLPLA